MKKIIDKLILIFLIVIIFVILLVICDFFIEKTLLPRDYLFYEHTPLFSLLLAPLLVVPSFFSAYGIIYYFKKKITAVDDDFFHIIWFVKSLGKWKIVIMLVWLIITYAGFTSFTYVTEDKIILIKPWDLQGQEYTYSDVESSETGFGTKKRAFVDYKEEGNFYYKITVGGQEVVFHHPSVNLNFERYEDTYLDLEEFDQALMGYNIPKIASSKGYDKCDFDKRYVDRFLRIIDSK